MNEDRFSGIAQMYARYRPSYPRDFTEYLYGEVGLRPSHSIADIGAGTGILTHQLLMHGSRVYAVEPNADMRAVAEAELSCYPRFISVNASAEHTTLDSGSVKYITVAQAFHWFDRAAFKRECQRILQENGLVILVWNSRDEKSELVQESDRINRQYCPDFKGFSGVSRGGHRPEDFADFFKNGLCEYREFSHPLFYDEQGFVGRSLTSSYAPKEGMDNYTPYVAALQALFARFSQDGQVCMPNIAKSYIGAV